MKKRIVCAVLALVMILALMGCSKSEAPAAAAPTAAAPTAAAPAAETNKDTFTQTEKDTAKVVGTAPSKAAGTTRTTATLAFQNDTTVDIYQMYFASSKDSEWGEEVLGNDAPLEDGYTITFKNRFTYSEDNTLWDLMVADSKDNAIKFECLDLTQASDPEYITVVLAYDADSESFTATIE